MAEKAKTTPAAAKQSTALVVKVNQEVTRQLASPAVMQDLIKTTFNGFTDVLVKQAITEGMLRGFLFQDFLNKNVYAIKYGTGYSLVTSIDYSRKIGMRSGIVGKTAPTYETDTDPNTNKEIIVSCTITVKKKDKDGYVGDFTETVYFNEYTTGKNQWLTKPRTMIAKVAEMHALRQACPEELAKAYVEEEFEQEVSKPEVSEETLILATEKLESAKNLEELKNFFAALPFEVKQKLEIKKNELKEALSKTDAPAESGGAEGNGTEATIS